MEIGTAVAKSGAISSGWFEVTELPTGASERLPVLIADGVEVGPTLWVTAALHGNEVTGIGAAQDVMTNELADNLSGTVVCIPILNPAGVRLNERNSYYHDEDPNRYFPYDVGVEPSPPQVQQLIAERLFDRFTESADALISLHEGWINEEVFAIVERVRYGDERTRKEAVALKGKMMELAEAFGLPIVREYDVDVQEAYSLQRSFECAAVNAAGVPALTPELGSPHIIEERPRRAAVCGIRNVMKSLDMLPGDPVENEAAPDKPVPYPVKRVNGPVAETPGIARHWVEPGDLVQPQDRIADIVTPHGATKATVEAEQEGYILGRREGVAVYENDILVSMAASDDGELVVDHH